jgi:hypothetical protein
MSDETALVKRDEQALALLQQELGGYEENAQIIEAAKLPEIKIVSKTAQFDFGENASEDERYQRRFETVIVDIFTSRSYWKEQMGSGPTSRPDCFSVDGVKPSAKVENPVSPACGTCPMAQFGSGFNGKRQACKMNRNLLVIDPLSVLPMPAVLRLPPTSSKAVDSFLVSMIKRKRNFRTVIAKFSLETKKSSGGVDYAELRLEPTDRDTPVEFVPAIKSLMDNPTMRLKITGGSAEDVPKEDVPF